MKLILILTMLGLASSCATRFTGDAHLSKKGCAQKCESWDMTVAGMVAMGEYSTACVCAPKKATQSQIVSLLNTSAVGSAASGVIMQMESEEQAQNSAMMMH